MQTYLLQDIMEGKELKSHFIFNYNNNNNFINKKLFLNSDITLMG